MKTRATERREVQQENINRWHEEIPLYNALPSVDFLNLKRIPLQAKDRNDDKHTEIDSNKTYLVCEGGKWYMGKFSLQWYGWLFQHGWSRSQLGTIDVIYEVLDLPEVPKHLIEPLPVPPEEDEDEEEY